MSTKDGMSQEELASCEADQAEAESSAADIRFSAAKPDVAPSREENRSTSQNAAKKCPRCHEMVESIGCHTCVPVDFCPECHKPIEHEWEWELHCNCEYPVTLNLKLFIERLIFALEGLLERPGD